MQRKEDDSSPNDRERGAGGCFHGLEPRVHGLLQAWLLLLLGERESYGYELVRQLAEELPEEMVPDPGVVYRMLRRLEHKGAATSTLKTGGGGPARKVYTLTDAGRSRLKGWSRTAGERIALLERFLHRLATFTEVSE